MSSAPAEIFSAIADRAEEIMQSQRDATQTGVLRLPTQVDGRVFRRLHRFARLPAELKAQADAVALYLSQREVFDRVFTRKPWALLAHARSRGRAVGPMVRGEALETEVHAFLMQSRAANASVHMAKQLVEILVLSGFISPVSERDDEPKHTAEASGPELAAPVVYIQPKAYYELVSPSVLHALKPPAERQTERLEATANKPGSASLGRKLSVWDVVDGATRAGHVFRKQPPSMLRSLASSLSCCTTTAPQGHEKSNYVVVNSVQHQAVVVFADDVARQELARVPLADAMVAFEPGTRHSPMYHGLKLWNDERTERFDFMSRHEQHEWLLSLLDGGARYKEAHRRLAKLIAAPFYSLHDVSACGDTLVLGDIVRGLVVLLVNTASKDPEAALQMPELVLLSDKYRDHGLRVLACPSDQFLALEFASDHEIMTHARQAYKARFRILTKRDVNGPNAREPYLYCNAHLPGVFGPFTEWNFTKFLVDRKGKPFRRFETHVRPLEMEGEIRKLLGLGQRCASTPDVAEELPEPAQAVDEIRQKTNV